MKTIVRPTVTPTQWTLSGAEDEVLLSGEMKAEVEKLSSYSVLLVHVGGHPVFMVIGREDGGFMKQVAFGGILEGDVRLDRQVNFKVPSGDRAIINSRSYDLSKGRVFMLEEGGSILQFGKHPKQMYSSAALTGFLDDVYSEASPSYVVNMILEAAKNENTMGFRRRLSRTFLSQFKGEISFGDFQKMKFLKTERIGSRDADVILTTTSGKKRNVTFVMVFEDGHWKLNGYGS